MAKKSKEKQKQQSPPNNNETSNSSDIFNTLFGTTPTDTNIASLFSDNNPFKRKPYDNPTATQEPKLDVLEASIDNQTDTTEIKIRKKKDKNVIFEETNEDKDGKSKRVSISGVEESNGEEANEDNDGKSKRVSLSEVDESNGVVFGSLKKKKDKKVILGEESIGEEANEDKKKRKKDEIEAEYEAKKYGVVDMDEVEKGIGEMVVGEKRKKMDNPEDIMVTNEGFDDESKLLRTIFVGNLDLKIKKKALMKEFGSFGEIESVRIRSIPLTDCNPRKAAIIKKKLNDNADSVNAYVVFKSEESAQASLAHNMAVVGGRHIRVNRACPPRKKMKGDNSGLYDNKRTVFVGNLPFDVKDEEIYQLFYGMKEFESSIEAVRVIRDPNTLLGKGIAYEAANVLFRKRNLKLRDRELRLSHSKANSTPSKRKNLSIEDKFRSPAKKFAVDPATPGSSSYKANTKSALSYQGVKASKSGVQKKTQSRMSDTGKLKPRTQISQKPNERNGKRPSVAARKAKELKAAASGLKQGGTKRKLAH
ncbi:hypothetical protein RND71_016013 [Anisodus tanguticus]|uniref:RRM domain-containing protein n=1 Tax=Anisodus tanguticus TaxID=243964 RepID=A0AAE1S7F2_9SOLA|nr:hypothetical protein RND71_016013 [Anisodus tanguticus]